MANWISWVKDDLGTGATTRDGMIANGATHGIQLSTDLPLLTGITTCTTLHLTGQLKDGDNAFGTSGQVLSSDGTDTRWVSSGELAAGAASQVAINDDSNTDAERFITLVNSSSGNNSVKTDASLKYNPSTNTITTVNITGNVTGNITGDLTGDVTGNVSGNAGTATVLQTARTIGGVSFNGSAAINLPGVNQAGNQNTSGRAATATALHTARTIGGVSFNGTTSINLPGVNQAGNQNTSGNAATATVLATERAFSITGEITANAINFNGSGAVELNATIDNNIVDEANLMISNGGTDGQFLQKQSGNTGGLTWATVDTSAGGLSGTTLASGVIESSLTTVGTLGQNLLIDNGTSTLVNVRCDNGGNAIVRAGGEGQGTGVFEVSQDNGSHGGGISYNGDGSPSFVSGESSDHVTFYRISGGTRTEVFNYPYSGNVVNFNSVPTVGGTNLARTTDNITGSSASCTGNAATATTASACSGNSVTATTATNANNVKIRTDSGNAYHNLLFVDAAADNNNQVLKMDDETSRLQWNPSLENLVAYTIQPQGLRQWSNGALGVAGQVLTSNGSSSPWYWSTPFSGSYNDLSSKPTIPTNTNQLTNGAGFLTSLAGAMTGNSKVTIKTSGSGTHTTQSWCRTLVAAFVGGGGGGGSSSAYHDDDDPSTYGAGGAGGTGGVKFKVANPGGSASYSWSVGGGGGTASGGGNTTFGGSTAGGGGGGGNAGNSGNASGGSAGSGDIPGKAGGTGKTNNKNQYSPFWGAYGSNGYGRYGTENGPTSGVGGCIIILELG